MKKCITAGVSLLLSALCVATVRGQTARAATVHIEQDKQSRVINVYRDSGKEPILTQNAFDDTRPYIHPIVAPDGKGLVTQFRPWHHPHQMGIFWGLKLVNGRDFFMRWQSDRYRKISASVIKQKGQQVQWQTIYDMLNENGDTVMTETQNWSMQAPNGKYILDLEWKGEARTDVTLGKYYVGGLFVRMPWHVGTRSDVVNAVGQHDKEAEMQRAKWLDVGMQVEGRDDLAHIAIFDHPDNSGFPAAWRVDDQVGFGPDIAFNEWRIDKGKTAVVRYRLIAYTGDRKAAHIERAWQEFAAGH